MLKSKFHMRRTSSQRIFQQNLRFRSRKSSQEMLRRLSNKDMVRRSSQGELPRKSILIDMLRRSSQGDMPKSIPKDILRRSSQEDMPIKLNQGFMMQRSSKGVILERRTLNGVLIRQTSNGDLLKRIKQLDGKGKPSKPFASRGQSKANILKRADQEYSVANAVAVIGVTNALLVGKTNVKIDHQVTFYLQVFFQKTNVSKI